MTLKSIEKLREWLDYKVNRFIPLTNTIELNTGAHPDELYEIADEIEAEIAERFIELPRDADSAPIRAGDYVIGVDDDKDTLSAVAYIAFDGEYWAVEEYFTEPPCFFPNFNDMKHASKPDPLKELLDEFATDIANYKYYGVDFDTYAERIRDLLGVKQ